MCWPVACSAENGRYRANNKHRFVAFDFVNSWPFQAPIMRTCVGGQDLRQLIYFDRPINIGWSLSISDATYSELPQGQLTANVGMGVHGLFLFLPRLVFALYVFFFLRLMREKKGAQSESLPAFWSISTRVLERLYVRSPLNLYVTFEETKHLPLESYLGVQIYRRCGGWHETVRKLRQSHWKGGAMAWHLCCPAEAQKNICASQYQNRWQWWAYLERWLWVFQTSSLGTNC